MCDIVTILELARDKYFEVGLVMDGIIANTAKTEIENLRNIAFHCPLPPASTEGVSHAAVDMPQGKP